MLGRGLLKGLGITAKHTFEKEITQQYPEERPYLQNRYRGSLAYDFPKCIACGLCIKACPNNVLTLNTFKDEETKKKKVDNFIIDLQYCLFCNLCVEICPTDTLYFTKEFELTQRQRDAIKKVYHRPPELDLITAEKETATQTASGEEKTGPDNEDKRLKQVVAMESVLAKNPAKTLAKILAAEEDIAVMTALMKEDAKKLTKLAELIVEDRDKAAKVASAWVRKGKTAGTASGQSPPPGGEEADAGAANHNELPSRANAGPNDRGSDSGTDHQAIASEENNKRLKQVEAIKNALTKNPIKTLAKILPREDDAAIMAELMNGDNKKLAKLTEFMVDDRDKAVKIASAWVNKARQDQSREGDESV